MKRLGVIIDERNMVIPAFEPKTKNRWWVNFPKDFGIAPWVLVRGTRPSAKIIDRFIECQPMEFSFLDPIAPSTTHLLWEAFLATSNGFRLKELPDMIHEAKERLGELSRGFDIELSMLDPLGNTVESWLLGNVVIKELNFGDLDYASKELAVCNMVVQPKYFCLNKIKIEELN